MIKSLRRRFIAIAMSSIAMVLILIIGSINVINYINMGRSVSERLDIIESNDGDYPQENDMNDVPPQLGGFHGAEAPFDTRYFTVSMEADGTVRTIDTGRIFAIDTKSAAAYAKSLYQKGKTVGYVNTYRYKRYTQVADLGKISYLYVFVDCERELRTFRTFAFASAGISLVGLLLVFLLVYLLSGLVIKPIAESYQKQKRFITDASHELKTPLTIIDANTEVIEMTAGESEWTTSTRKQVKRLAQLTEKLVFLSRMDEESVSLDMMDFSLTEAVLDVVKPYEAVARASGKTLVIDVAEGITYHGSEKEIRQLVALLLDNAMKYASEEGTVKVLLIRNGKNLLLTVYNTVEKIQPGRHDELFERFYRADASHNSQTGGFGIGLSVALAIVSAHRGRIVARSKDDTSIQFEVTF